MMSQRGDTATTPTRCSNLIKANQTKTVCFLHLFHFLNPTEDELRGCIKAWRKTKEDCFELWVMQSSSKRGQEQQQVHVKPLKTQLPETGKLFISDEPSGPELAARF